MTATRFGAYRPARIAGMAHPYTESDGVLTDVSERVQLANPSGGAISTAADMLHFAHALLSHELLSPEMTGTVMTGTARTDRPGPRSVGESYGLGFVDATHSGVRIVGHNGGTPGYEAQLDIYPDQDTAVVALSNRDGIVSDVIRGSESVMVKEVTGTTGTRGPAATGGAAGSKATEYSRCMRRNGVSGFPTPGADGRIQLRPGSGPDPGSTAFKTAEKACEALAPPRVGG